MTSPDHVRAPQHRFELGDNIAEDAKTPKVSLGAADAYQHKSWIQVARLGKYTGHPAGAFEFTVETFARMVENFEQNNENGMVPLDFEHASEAGYADGSSAATGWIVQLQNRGEAGLWGLVEWLEPGLSLVRAGRYKFFSPTVAFNYLDARTGKRIGPVLLSGALTNRPFLDGMAQVTARAPSLAHQPKDDNQMNLDTLVASLKAALGNSNITAENAAEHVQKLRDAEREATAEVAKMKAEALRMSAIAAVKELVEFGVIDNADSDAIDSAAELRMSSPAMFDKLFKVKLSAAKTSRANAPAKSDSSATASSAASIVNEVRAQLGTQLSANSGDKPSAAGTANPQRTEGATLSLSDRVARRAHELAKSDPKSYALTSGAPNQTAFQTASREVSR